MTWALQRTPSFVSTVPVIVGNTTTATALIVGSAPITQYVGNISNVIADGTVEFSSLSHTLTLVISAGATTLATVAILGSDIPGGVITTAYHWSLDTRYAPQSGPASNAVMNMFGSLSVTGPTGKLVFDFAEAITLNTNTASNFGITAQWSNAAATNIFTATNVAVAS